MIVFLISAIFSFFVTSYFLKTHKINREIEIAMKREKEIKQEILRNISPNSFCNSNLLEEIKKAYDDYVLILWWGDDGIRLNHDGTTKWISKKQKHTQPSFCNFNENVAYQPMQYLDYKGTDYNSPESKIRLGFYNMNMLLSSQMYSMEQQIAMLDRNISNLKMQEM